MDKLLPKPHYITENTPSQSAMEVPAGYEMRQLTPADSDALGALYGGLSGSSRRLRFFVPMGPESAAIQGVRYSSVGKYASNVAYDVTVARPDGSLAAHGSLAMHEDDKTGELAVVVADSEQGKGLGTVVTAVLMEAAIESDKIEKLIAEMMPENSGMQKTLGRAANMLANLPAEPSQHWVDGHSEWVLDTRKSNDAASPPALAAS